jgi:hypothetical protein
VKSLSECGFLPQIMKDFDCCYFQYPEEGTIHIGANGGDSHWICFRPLERWNETCIRFIVA